MVFRLTHNAQALELSRGGCWSYPVPSVGVIPWGVGVIPWERWSYPVGALELSRALAKLRWRACVGVGLRWT